MKISSIHPKKPIGLKSSVAGIFCLLLSTTALGQLSLDPTFGDNGKVVTQIPSFTSESVSAMAVDSVNRVVATYADLDGRGIARFTAGGSLDTAFGAAGVVQLDFFPLDIALQTDGKIVAVGSRADGGILTEDWQIVRLLADGSLDPSFADSGVLILDWYAASDQATSVVLDSSGNIYVGGRAFVGGAGTAFAVLKLDNSGAIVQQRADKLFTGTADICQDILLQDDGKVVCAGLARTFSAASMIAVRYESDLQLDITFGTNGVARVEFGERPAEANAALLQPNGSLVLAGQVDNGFANGSLNLALARLTSSGTLDSSFGTGGRVEQPIDVDTNESILDMLEFEEDIFVAARTFETESFAMLRFSADGVLDSTFGTSGLALVNFNGGADSSRSLVVHQSAVLLGGGVDGVLRSEGKNLGLARLTSSGHLDSNFGNNGLSEVSLLGPVAARALDAVHQPDGKLVMVGFAGISFSTRSFSLARYRVNGELDTGFGDQGIVITDFADDQDSGMAIDIQADGRLVAVGEVRIPPATSNDIGIARYNSNGQLDSNFGVNGLAVIDVDGNTDIARAVKVLADGSILVAGESRYPSQNFEQNFTVAKLLSNGSLDSSFGNGGTANVSVGGSNEGHALAVQADGKILLGGSGDSDFAMARFTVGGALDSSFGTAGIVTFDFFGKFDFLRELVIIPDWSGQGERILAVGTALDGSSLSSAMFAAALFKLDGSLETDFGNAGSVTVDLAAGMADEALDVALLDNRIVLAGYTTINAQLDFAVLGLTLDGIIDNEFFSGSGSAFVDFFGSSDEANAVSVSPTGQLVLAGYALDPTQSYAGQQFALARFAISDLLFRNGFESTESEPVESE